MDLEEKKQKEQMAEATQKEVIQKEKIQPVVEEIAYEEKEQQGMDLLELANRDSNEEYEEISEKKTSKLGYVLLFFMVIFVIGVGETIFADLRNILEKPVAPSQCALSSAENIVNANHLNCSEYVGFNSVDRRFDIDVKYNEMEPQLQEVVSLNKEIALSKKQLNAAELEFQKLNGEYDLSLQEKMAEEEAIMNIQQIRDKISIERTNGEVLRKQIKNLEAEKSKIIAGLALPTEDLKQSYKEAQEYYQNKKAWYKFKAFLLTLVFILPLFAISVFYYLKFKKRNSPYTIILTAITTAFAFLFLQVMVVFLYDILPKEWLARVFRFFLAVPFLRYVIYYGATFLIIGIFGGIVFYIQKRVFSTKKVAVRRLKDKKCPGCSFPINYKHNFCPDCGLRLKEVCKNCGGKKIRYLAHCPNCGKESV